MDAALKDVRAALEEVCFAMVVQKSIDFVDEEFASALGAYLETSGIDTATIIDWMVLRHDGLKNNLPY